MTRTKNIGIHMAIEEQIVEQLYILMRLEHSKKRCEAEGTLSTEEVRKHFAEKRRNYAGV